MRWCTLFSLFWVSCFFSTGIAWGEERVIEVTTNFNQHSSIIWRADLDANEKRLVTASPDRTAKIWEIRESGRIRFLKNDPPSDI